MKLGSPQIVVCPLCKGLGKYRTLLSGNYIDARLWTDGKLVAPMFPQAPAVVKCKYCKDYYWLSEADRFSILNLLRKLKAVWTHPEFVEEPSEEEYYQAIRKNLAKTPQQEKVLRILAWRRRNDAYRGESTPRIERQVDTSLLWRENLESLLSVLDDPSESDLIVKAETLRHLGRFQEATKILERISSPEYTVFVSQIRHLCETRDTFVGEIRLPRGKHYHRRWRGWQS